MLWAHDNNPFKYPFMGAINGEKKRLVLVSLSLSRPPAQLLRSLRSISLSSIRSDPIRWRRSSSGSGGRGRSGSWRRRAATAPSPPTRLRPRWRWSRRRWESRRSAAIARINRSTERSGPRLRSWSAPSPGVSQIERLPSAPPTSSLSSLKTVCESSYSRTT